MMRTILRVWVAVAFLRCISWSAAADLPISQLPLATSVSGDDLLVIVDDPTGSTPRTKKVAFSNLVSSIGVSGFLGDTNQFGTGNGMTNIKSGALVTNLMHKGTFTNRTGDIRMSSSDDGSADGHALRWYSDTLADNVVRGQIWFNKAHPDEMQVDSLRSISINLGGDGQERGVGQLGTSNPTHEVWMYQWDKQVSGGDPLCYSKFASWCTRYYNSGILDRHLGFRAESLDTAGNSELAFYSSFKEFSQSFDDPFTRKVGGFGTNNCHFQNFISTNSILIGTAAGNQAGANPVPGLTPGAYGLDIASGTFPGLMLGAELSATTRGVNSNKYGVLGFAPKNNLTPVVGLNFSTAGGATGSGSTLMVGGGTGVMQSLNLLEFYCATNQGEFNQSVPQLVINSTTVAANASMTVRAGSGTSGTVGKVGGTIKTDTQIGSNIGGGEDLLYTYSVPANVLASNGDRVKFDFYGKFGTNAHTKTVKFYWNNVVLAANTDTPITAGNACIWHISGFVLRDAALAYHVLTESDYCGVPHAGWTPTVADNTTNIVVKITGEDNDGSPVSGSVVYEGSWIEWHPGNN